MDSKLPDDSTPDEFPSSGNDQQQTLLMRLDELILSYFDILDVYSELQKHISQDISSVIIIPFHFDVFFVPFFPFPSHFNTGHRFR